MWACHKGTEGVEVYTRSLLTSAIKKGCELHAPNALPTGKETTVPIREEVGWASHLVLILWIRWSPLPLLGMKWLTCHFNDIALAVHQSVSTGLLQYGESDGFGQWQTMAETLMTYSDSFSNKKLLGTREYSGTEQFPTQCRVRGSDYSIGQNIAQQTSYGNNWVTRMMANVDPQPHCSKHRQLWKWHIYTVPGELILPASTAFELVTTLNHQHALKYLSNQQTFSPCI
jgi:hypothetical protein